MSEPAETELPRLRELLARVHLRLILFAVVVAAASLVVSGMIVIRNYAQRNLDLAARTISYTIEPAVVFDDREAMVEAMSSLAANATVDRIEVRAPNGQVLANWNHDRTMVRSWFEHRANALIWPHPSVARIERGGALLAEVRLYGNSGGILSYGLSGLLISFACVGLTVIATRILARRLQRDVIDPLDHVAQVAHAVRRERAFERRVPSSGIAEIDRFGQDFNALLAELQGWHAGLTSENAELARKATHDPLTGLGNRVLFEQTLGQAIGEAARAGASFAVLYLDIDNFKQINDVHGHESGDAALIAVGERLRGTLRQIDHAFRLGGDEFAALLLPLQDRAHVEGVVDRIRQVMELPFRLPSGDTVVSHLSIGVAVYPDDGSSQQDLLRRADSEMYKQKKQAQLIGPSEED